MSLFDAIQDVPKPPCERGLFCRCENYSHCKTNLLACESFEGYTNGRGGRRGKPLSKENPTHERYLRIMSTDGFDDEV